MNYAWMVVEADKMPVIYLDKNKIVRDYQPDELKVDNPDFLIFRAKNGNPMTAMRYQLKGGN